MTCPNCGFNANGAFCPKCGTKIESPAFNPNPVPTPMPIAPATTVPKKTGLAKMFNFMPIIVLAVFYMLLAALAIEGDFFAIYNGRVYASETFTYAEMLFNAELEIIIPGIFFIIIAVMFFPTIILNFISPAIRKGVGMVFGLVTATMMFGLIVANLELAEFTRYLSVKYNYEYTAILYVNIVLAVATVLLIVSSILGFIIERKKYNHKLAVKISEKAIIYNNPQFPHQYPPQNMWQYPQYNGQYNPQYPPQQNMGQYPQYNGQYNPQYPPQNGGQFTPNNNENNNSNNSAM